MAKNNESVSGNAKNTRNNPLLISATTANFNIEKEIILHGQSDTESFSKGGPFMVNNLEFSKEWCKIYLNIDTSKKMWDALCHGMKTGDL